MRSAPMTMQKADLEKRPAGLSGRRGCGAFRPEVALAYLCAPITLRSSVAARREHEGA
jgi:hypothetical protein